MKKIFLTSSVLLVSLALNAQFTVGNLVVLEVGDGVTALSSAANPMALTEYTTGGVAVQTISIPSTGPGQHTMSGTATSEGLISLSGDLTRIIIPGYAAPAGTAGIASTSGATVNRAIASVDALENYTQNVLSSTFFSGNNIRSATSNGSNTFWATGANTGYCYFGLGTPAVVSTTSTNNRAASIIAGNTFFSTGSGTRGIYQINGTPTSGPQTAINILPTGATSSPFQFAANLANGVAYVADDRNTASGGGIQKWVFAGTWTLAYTFDCGSGFGARGLVADFSGPNPVLYATTADGTANRLIRFTDLGAPSPFTLLATAPANKLFRGLVFAPIVPPTIQFASAHQSVLENAGTANVTFNMTSAPNAFAAKVILTTSVHTTATGGGVDYTLSTDTVTFPAGVSTPQNFVVNINNDALPENAEYISFKVASTFNATITGTNQFHILYIRDNDYTPPTPTNEVMLQLLNSFSTGAEGSNSAEIVAYDSSSQKLVTANSIANRLDIIDFSNPSAPGPITSVSLSALGGINSVDVRNGFIAVALQGINPQDSGKIAFYNMTGTLVSQVTVGAMPDMIAYNHAGTKVYAPCEGEPTLSTYAQDPEGTIAVVDVSGGIPTVNNSNVTIINFNSFNPQIATLRAAGVRIYGNLGLATVSQDLEPEYITISDDDQTGWVTLQEANAIAKVNLVTNTVTNIIPLGTANHSLVSNGLDASDQTSGINIANFPVKGLYLPDAITHMNIGGTNYIFTANEGDSRADFGAANNEESRISGLTLDPTAFVDQNILKSNFFLGRLNATNRTGDTDNDGDIDEINVYGSRGFSVWNENGVLLYNSGNLLEKIIAGHPTFSAIFNATNSNSVTPKNRSDDKGPEIEGVTVANIDGDNILFASSERIGGVFLFNIDNPVSPRYIGYYNNRTTTLPSGPDRGAEGIVYISAEESPNGNPIVILANEISSTLTIYQVNTCASLSGIDITTTPNDTICSGNNAVLSTTVTGSPALQWLNNNANISGATGTSTSVNNTGLYSLAVQNASFSCVDTTAQTQIVVNPLPSVSGSVTDNDICNGDTVVFTGSGATSYTWTSSVIDGGDFIPSATNTYTVTGTDANGCSNTSTVSVTVNALPTVVANVTDNDICNGDTVVFTGSGANSYVWTNSVVDNIDFIPVATDSYTVAGTDVNGCSNTSTITVTVNTLPTVAANVTDNDICSGDTVVFSGSGATSYAWTNSVLDNTDYIPAATNTYTVTGTDANGCSNTSTVSVNVNALPAVVANVTDNDICNGSSVTFTGSGATSYTWTGGVTDGTSFTPAATGTYTVTGTDVNSCSNTSTVTVIVNNLPTVTFNLTTDSVCVNHGVLSLTGGSPAGGTFSGSGVTGASFNPATGTGNYTITYTYTDANGCINTDTENLLVSGCLSIYNETVEEVMIYPNPTESFFYLKTSTNEMYNLTIIDMSGKVVYANTASDAEMIDVSQLSTGVYIVKLENNQKIYRSRLIKK